MTNDLPGLDEAIEAAWAEYTTRLIDDDRRAVEFAVRAAAPVLVRAALLAASEGYVGRCGLDMCWSYVCEYLIERAESITPQR